MSTEYTKTNWQDGDIITADKMNNIENGVKGVEEDIATVKDGLQAVQTEVAATLITDTASGSIASFPDGADNVPVKSLTVDIEPVQDLHGQDAPYPSGGGKNKLDMSWLTSRTVSGVTITNNGNGIVLSGTASATVLLDGTVFELPSGTYTVSGSISNNQIYVRNSTGTTLAESASGAANSFTLSETTSVYVRFRISGGTQVNGTAYYQIESGSAKTAYAPYSNICPISGHTQAVVTRTGFNVWDEEWEVGGILTSTENKGQNYSASDRIRSKNYIPCKGGTEYYFTYSLNSDEIYFFFYDKNKTYISDSGWKSKGTITTPANAVYIRFQSSSTYGSSYQNDISINYPSTDHDYHAYTGDTYTIDLDGTRYGGTLDVTTGVLTVDRQIVDLGSIGWSRLSTNVENKYRFVTSAVGSEIKRPSTYMITGEILCSCFGEVRGDDLINNVTGIGVHTNGNIIAYSEEYATYTDTQFKTAMNGQTLVYPLATPQTIQLSANEISTLLGQNNIWNDCGDTTVEYRADTKLYINKMLNA